MYIERTSRLAIADFLFVLHSVKCVEVRFHVCASAGVAQFSVSRFLLVLLHSEGSQTGCPRATL